MWSISKALLQLSGTLLSSKSCFFQDQKRNVKEKGEHTTLQSVLCSHPVRRFRPCFFCMQWTATCWLKVRVWKKWLWNCFEKCFQCHLSFFLYFVFNYFFPLFSRFPELFKSSHMAYSLLPVDLFILPSVSMSLLSPPHFFFSNTFFLNLAPSSVGFGIQVLSPVESRVSTLSIYKLGQNQQDSLSQSLYSRYWTLQVLRSWQIWIMTLLQWLSLSNN